MTQPSYIFPFPCMSQDAPGLADTIGAIAQDAPTTGQADTTATLPHETVKDLHELFVPRSSYSSLHVVLIIIPSYPMSGICLLKT